MEFSAVSATHPPTRCPPASLAQPFYRAYSPAATDHFYTTNKAEFDNAVANLGYSAEGIACKIFPRDVGGGTVPFFRLGFTSEGIAGYIFTDNRCGGIPLYRLYHPTILDHFYTTSAPERDNAKQNLGYSDEGIAGYVVPA